MELTPTFRCALSPEKARRLYDEVMANPCVQVMSEQELDYIREWYEGRPENMPHHAHLAILLPIGLCLAHVHPLRLQERYVDFLFVHPNYRRIGLGTTMMNAMQPWIAGPLPETLDFYRTLDCRLYYIPCVGPLAINVKDEDLCRRYERQGAVLIR